MSLLYALRKLIAFVFLGGIFWFIYSDPAEIGSPVFMHTLGALTLAFAAFWLVIPWAVVSMRIRNRKRQNAARYAVWREALGDRKPEPLPRKAVKLELPADERVYLHEKGTLYVPPKAGFDAISAKGLPGDVAFPGLRRNSRKIQRTHCYFTDRQLVLAGKQIDFRVPYADFVKVSDRPGGLVFTLMKDGRRLSLAFTFQNPLVAADYVEMLWKK